MESKLQKFLNDAFAPYGDFPARNDVVQELHANLVEKFNDLKREGKSDEEAYQLTIDSFGDVTEIMEHVPHAETTAEGTKEPTANGPTPKASALMQADLTDSDLAHKDFSKSALMESSFDRSDMHGATFKSAALKAASFAEANVRDAVFTSSDLQNVNFNKANLTNATFNKSDLSGVSFDGLTLDGVSFNNSSLKNASFKNTVLRNVSFYHSAVKHAVFDGATMDKLTYALLKGAKATLTDVTVQ
ncbi:MAG TPA: pentapeptide repeat-containing protein [Candidatus Saccharimonadales bacterium]